MTKNIGIYVFNEMEVLDFAGPFEVFSTASRVKIKMDPAAEKPFHVFTVGANKGEISACGGLMILPSFELTNHPPLQLLIIPGGVVIEEMRRQPVLNWIKSTSESSEITASVCTGAFLLAEAGLLRGLSATTHWDDIQDLRSMFPDTQVQADIPWVDNGKVVTSAGISAGIGMSLHLVARLEGMDLARRTARVMEFDWKDEYPAEIS